jgi:membrane protease subunit HflC
MVFAGWRISEPTLFFPKFAGGSIAEAERTLEAIIRSAKNEVIGQHPFNHFISVNEKDLKFAEVENEILKKVQQQLAANNYGITVEFLGIKKLGLPESVTQNVFERMQSERQVRVSEIEAQGTVAATTTRAKADSDAAKLISDAEAEAVRIRGEGEAAAAKSFEVFKQEPELANFLIQLTGLEIFLRERTTLVLDRNTSPLNLLTPVPQRTNASTGRALNP